MIRVGWGGVVAAVLVACVPAEDEPSTSSDSKKLEGFVRVNPTAGGVRDFAFVGDELVLLTEAGELRTLDLAAKTERAYEGVTGVPAGMQWKSLASAAGQVVATTQESLCTSSACGQAYAVYHGPARQPLTRAELPTTAGGGAFVFPGTWLEPLGAGWLASTVAWSETTDEGYTLNLTALRAWHVVTGEVTTLLAWDGALGAEGRHVAQVLAALSRARLSVDKDGVPWTVADGSAARLELAGESGLPQLTPLRRGYWGDDASMLMAAHPEGGMVVVQRFTQFSEFPSVMHLLPTGAVEVLLERGPESATRVRLDDGYVYVAALGSEGGLFRTAERLFAPGTTSEVP